VFSVVFSGSVRLTLFSSIGKVKLGFHRDSGFKVAIKIIAKNTLQSRPAMQQKLEREIAIMKFLDHPNVLRLYDVYDTPNYLFLVLEHVEGGELFDYLLSKKVLPESEALTFFQQLVEGVEYCLADDHQILTNEGFLGMWDLKKRWNSERFTNGLKVAAFDEGSQRMQFEDASRFVLNKWREQELVEFGSLDLRVTMEHDMYVQFEFGGAWSKVTAASLLEMGSRDANATCRMLLSPREGCCSEDFRSVEPVVELGITHLEEAKLFVRMYGCWLSGRPVVGPNGWVQLFRASPLPLWVWSLGNELSRELLAGFKDAPRKRSRDFESLICRVSSMFLRDDVMRVALQCGMSATAVACEGGWRVTCETNNVVSVRLGDLRRVPYAGQTWCVTVPSGKIFARGRTQSAVAIVGNCHNHLICHRDLYVFFLLLVCFFLIAVLSLQEVRLEKFFFCIGGLCTDVFFFFQSLAFCSVGFID
jgi:hypothetical protein